MYTTQLSVNWILSHWCIFNLNHNAITCQTLPLSFQYKSCLIRKGKRKAIKDIVSNIFIHFARCVNSFTYVNYDIIHDNIQSKIIIKFWKCSFELLINIIIFKTRQIICWWYMQNWKLRIDTMGVAWWFAQL